MAGAKWAHKIQLGREATPYSVPVAATTIWRGVGGNLKDDQKITIVDEQIGIAVPSNRSYLSQTGGSLAMAATPATFEQLPHIFEAGIKSVGTGAADGAGTSKIYAYPMGISSVNTIKTYTIQTGDNEQAELMPYSFVEKFTLTGERGEAVMVSADWIGRYVAETTFTGSLTVPAVDEILTSKANMYIDDIDGTIGTTAVTSTLLAWELEVNTGWRGKWVADKGILYFDFAYFDRDSWSAEFSATYEHNATALAEKQEWRDNLPRLIRLNIGGPNVTTPGTTYATKVFRIDMALRYTEFDALDTEDGNSIVKVKGTVGYDSTAAKALEFTVVNELTSIP